MDQNEIKDTMMNLKKWAVVGATPKKEKFGYKIWKMLPEHGYTAYGVHPVRKEIEGRKVYQSLSELPETPDVINMIVGPQRGGAILEEGARLGIKYVFFQPGSYDEELVKKAEELGYTYLTGDCVYAILKNQ